MQACEALVHSGQQERPLWVLLGVAIGGAACGLLFVALQWYGRNVREARAGSLLVQPAASRPRGSDVPGELKLAAPTDSSAI